MKRLSRNVWVLALTSFLTDVSSEMLLNLMPLYLVNVLGVGTALVGLIEGVAEATSSFVKIYSGRLSDRLGRQKALAVLGYAFSTLMKPGLLFANTWSWVFGVRFGDRIGKGIRTAPRDALLAGSVEQDQRGLAFGLHRSADTAGAFTGLILATIIIYLTQTKTTLLSQGTFRVVVFASLIPAILAVVVLALGAQELSPKLTRKVTKASGFRWSQLDHRFKAFVLILIIFSLGNSSDAFIVLRGQERGLTVLQLMGMALSFNGVYAILSGPLGSLSDKYGRRALILGGWVIYGLIYLGIALAKTGVHVWILYTLYGVYYAATEGTAKALIADLVPPAQRGTAYGIYHGAVGITALPASLLGGLLWQGIGSWGGFGPAAPFYFGAILALLAGVLLLGLVKA
jgi:MFS family permease